MFYWILFIIPKKLLSRLVGYFADLKLPSPILRPLLKGFSHYYQLNLAEAKYQLHEFESLNALFTRELKPGVRPIAESLYVHPADSYLVTGGKINLDFRLQAKQVSYSIEQMLPNFDSQLFQDGEFALYYLCPTDYHRVHSPVAGFVKTVTHIPGCFWPVNQWSADHICGLFYKNERVIVEIETQIGLVMVILVAATNVGQMSLRFDPSFRTNSLKARGLWSQSYLNLKVAKGEELGTFHMGSTVVVMTSSEFSHKNPLNFVSQQRVQVGQSVTG